MDMTWKTWLALLAAAVCEVGGDYAVRLGRLSPASRLPWTAVGIVLLAVYGVAVTYGWKGDFGHLLGVYVAVFFVVSQAFGLYEDGPATIFTAPRVLGAILILAGGAAVQWGGRLIDWWRPG